MKIKLLSVLIAALSLTLVACGNSEDASSDKPEENTETVETSNSDELSQAEWMEKRDEINGEAKAEVTDKVFYTHNDETTGGTPTVVSYAIIKNTGKTTIDISQTKLTYLNSSGGVIGTTDANAMYQNLSPSVLGPDEVAYLAISEDAGEEFADLKDIQVEVTPFVAGYEVLNLNPQKVDIIKTDDWGGDVRVTGFLQNDKDIVASDVEVSAGLFDKQNKFIGVLMLGSTDEITVQPKSQSSFEIGIPTTPISVVPNVDHADVRSIGFDFE